jgi:DNA-binding response OmpR family regulator
MDGLELLRALQSMVPTPVLMAISGDRDALTQARRFTPHTFAKPLPLEQVLAAVRNLDLRPRGSDETT